MTSSFGQAIEKAGSHGHRLCDRGFFFDAAPALNSRRDCVDLPVAYVGEEKPTVRNALTVATPSHHRRGRTRGHFATMAKRKAAEERKKRVPLRYPLPPAGSSENRSAFQANRSRCSDAGQGIGSKATLAKWIVAKGIGIREGTPSGVQPDGVRGKGRGLSLSLPSASPRREELPTLAGHLRVITSSLAAPLAPSGHRHIRRN